MPNQTDLALALIRIATGGVFIVHGWQKIFAAGLTGVAAQYAAVGVPLPLLVVPVTATLELLGGLLLLLGLGARGLAGVLGALTVVVSAFRWLHGALSEPALETSVLLMAGSAAILLGGAGRPSVEQYRVKAAPPQARLKRGR
ncbi:DoxX family membrane protein [Deinococcus sp. KSM4-11]|uniref:DoxX family membrane protein n=1 Tax=Deinococcus sp. KSM4-11 TaxID=2568654 RepID=UPI0010A463B0|nr:DoxX family membrane protein [Deinococcus sp. KSM4-11]THF88256.1 DoxX family membrane protein [Deinococcus sp. KSM4-11]